MNDQIGTNKLRMMAGAGAVAVALVIAVVVTTAPTLARSLPSVMANWTSFSKGAAKPATVAPMRAAALMSTGASMTEAPPADIPTAVTFTVGHYECNTTSRAQLSFSINGTAAGTTPTTNVCAHNVTPLTFTVTDAAAIAACSDPGCTQFIMTKSGGNARIAYVRASVTRSVSGVETVCVFDQVPSNNCANRNTNLGVSAATTFQNSLVDTDADGIPNCSDPDMDGDSIANALDNCPVVANADQLDANGNGVGDLCEPAVVAVPWLGNESLPHQVYSGGSVVLQAAALKIPGTGDPLPLTSATWDPGDPGSTPQTISVANPLGLELTHTYTGIVGTPFTATIRATATDGTVYTDTFKVVIAQNNRDTKVNMAIDKALWNLHKRMQRTTSDGLPSGFWSGFSNYYMAASAGTVQAFEINNHRESGSPLKDPYVNDVARGLRYVLSLQHGLLQQMSVPTQNSNVTDNNANGYGLVVSPTDHSSYISGQVMDALVASGTPTKTAETGQATYVKGRTYQSIVQDLLDGYSYGMADNTGGWHYTYQGVTGNNDTSASHWWAIGVLASEVWGMSAPQWVKDIQWNTGVPLMQAAPGVDSRGCYFGYTNSAGNWWGDSQTNVTAAGLILMNADGKAKTEARFACAEKWLDSFWSVSVGNFYTMYQTAKAMRTAKDSTGATSGITMLNGTRDWYADFADYLITNQNTYGTGEFRSVASSIGSYIQTDMATSWGVIILSPSLFELPPTVSCSAVPNTIGTHGGTVAFSATASHPEQTVTITSYVWDFGDGSPAGSGATTSHAYTQPASFPTTRAAKVTVTDSRNHTATAQCPVTIVNTNVPPSAVPGGPYSMCPGSPLVLDGSGSTDEDGTIASYKWSWGSIDFANPKALGVSPDVTAQFSALSPGTYDLGLQVTDNDGASNTSGGFTSVVVHAANDPVCNQPPVAANDTALTNSGTPVAVSVLDNDTDPDVPAQTLTVTTTTQGASGSVSTNGTTVTYTPNDGFAGTDTFNYTISDGHAGTASATVTVTVTKRTATVTAGGGTKVYGSADPAFTPSSTGFLAGDGITVTQTARDPGEDVGSYPTHATAAGAKIVNYDVTYTDGSLEITKAPSTTLVSCPASVVFNGLAQTPCSVTVTGVGGLSLTPTPAYANNVNAGTANAGYTYLGDANHDGSNDAKTFTITQIPSTTTLATSQNPSLSGSSVTFTATVGAAGPRTGTVTFTDGSTVLGTSPVSGGQATLTTSALALGPHTIVATYNGDNNVLPSASAPLTQWVYAYAAGGGTFVIGDQNATLGRSVTFWGSQWEKLNSLSGGPSNASFKGFAIAPAAPTVGATFTAAPGNSGPPPSGVASYIGIIVTSKVTKSGSNITGTIVGLVIVRVDPGYAGDPGHAGTGTIVAVIH